MASPENQHCANCIGTLSFPILTCDRGRRANTICPVDWQQARRCIVGPAHGVLDNSNYIGLHARHGWWRSTVVERRSLAGELSLSCARPAADG